MVRWGALELSRSRGWVKLVVGLLILLTILCYEVVTMTRTNAKCHFCSKARKAEVSGADDFLQFALVFPGQV